MQVTEDPQFSKDYLDPEKRSIANSVQVYFKDGTHTDKIQIEYPIGHKRRRQQGIPLLIKKFEDSFAIYFPKEKTTEMTALFLNQEKLENMPVNEFMGLWVR